MARLHPQNSVPITSGVEVESPRGYGVVVSRWHTSHPDFPLEVPFMLVELEDGSRYVEQAANLRVIDRG